MPGLDLFTRRRVRLCRYWLSGKRKFLDAGFGNGWFSYLAYRSGAEVTAVDMDCEYVQKAKDLYNVWLKAPADKLNFRRLGLYDLDSIEPGFDEIICYETLEHIKDDTRVCKSFWNLLKPGGFLHICCPYAEHPRWMSEILNSEHGSHVRAGYTLDSYRALLEPIGFRIVVNEGMGGVFLSGASNLMESLRDRLGHFWGPIFCLPVLLIAIPIVWLDPRDLKLPYSLYIKAVKRADL